MPDTARLRPERSPRCAHWDRITLAWLEGLVGGRAALLALTDEPAPPPRPPALASTTDGAAYDAVVTRLDRVTELYDAEVAAILDWALATAWHRRPALFDGRASALAGGLVWVVGKANGLFDRDLRPCDVQGALELRSPLRPMGLRLAPVVGRTAPVVAPRPMEASDLTGFGEAALLTPTTRREVTTWRDLADSAGSR